MKAQKQRPCEGWEVRKLIDALGVILLDEHIQRFLQENDKMAFRQCCMALAAVRGKNRVAKDILNRLPQYLLEQL